jgi:translation initiation factor IF-3
MSFLSGDQISKKFNQINQFIKAETLRLIDREGKQLGVMSKSEALKLAIEQKLDVVLVSPEAKPPVAKLISFSNFKYQQQKKDQAGRKKAKSTELKEIRLTPFIAENDLKNRIDKAKDFLNEGDRVKITVKFVGRQITRKEFGFQVLDKVTQNLAEFSQVDQPAKMMGKILMLTLKPNKKVKTT